MRIMLLAGGVFTCGVTAWLCSGSNDGAPTAVMQPNNVPARTAWGWSPFASGPAQATDSAFASAPAPLYGRNGRAVDFGGLSAADYIAQWSARARTGDAAAAYKVYQAADVCANLAEPLPDFTTDREREDAQAERTRTAQACNGVSAAQIDERMRFLADAARSGNVEAQIDFFMEGPNGKPEAQATDEAALRQWKGEALNYLNSAAQHGDAFALGLLANAYDAGNIVAADAGTSLAYTVANAAARKVDPSLDALHSRFSQLAPADFDDAVERGRRIGAACCAR